MSIAEKVSANSDPLKIYYSMLEDIEKAKKYIYIETFRFENDPIGIKFRNLLAKKAREGVKIMILTDAWGTSVNSKFFKMITDYGGEVKFFKSIRFALNLFLVNHERDHRKLLIIDDFISYISSINISNYNLNWREFSLRIEGELAVFLKKIFLENYNLKNTYKFDKKRSSQIVKAGHFEIVRDVPSVRYQRIRKRFVQLINISKHQVFIETPYFLPTFLLTEALIAAAKRKVDVNIIIPRRSDVTVVDRLRQYYLGRFYEAGVKIWYYLPTNLHSKLFISDQWFYAGSTNFDYRSFRYMFEIGLFGTQEDIWSVIMNHIHETLSESIPFDYHEWKNRAASLKIIERLLLPVKHLL
ncbi:MAG: phosphatidylserine/phosphatidylglycerophosphate/cardiolipin synthase family protein [Sphingobacteriales bacterium]|nr:phosphatidylserine/phosphatidylglycerophosphate/cardiolipin synthase family protein [Sphingobacteriales bacterium]